MSPYLPKTSKEQIPKAVIEGKGEGASQRLEAAQGSNFLPFDYR